MSSNKELEDAVALGKMRWTIPILSSLAVFDGARFVELRRRLGMARESLARTLDFAIKSGWVIRNSGHGHPLRPEYLLTEEGKRIAAKASAILKAQSVIGLKPADIKKWSMPIIRSIADGHQRFNELSRALRPAGPRALSQSLRALTERHLVMRNLIEGYPPSSMYKLTASGRILAKAI